MFNNRNNQGIRNRFLYFDFDLHLCEVFIANPKEKGWGLYPPYIWKRMKWSVCVSTRMTDNVIHCWFYLSTWICFLFWSDGVQYCSVRDISLKEVLQLQRRADAKGKWHDDTYYCWECALLDHLSSMPKVN